MATRTSSVLGPDGAPLKVSVLTDDIMPPSTSGARRISFAAVANGMTPTRLAAILRDANDGNNVALLTLAEEMEERDPHYASVLGQRKRAVSGIEPIVKVDGLTDTKVSDAVEALIGTPIFADMVDELLDAIAKGYSVIQPIWRYGALWTPKEYIHHDPRHFQFDKETGRELRIRDDGEPDGRAIANYTLVVHRPHLKSGLTVRAGLARLVAWTFMLKSYTLQDWAAFLEVFGMPLRVGRYDRDASAAEKGVLLRAVRNLASDAAAIIPRGMDIEFIEASGGSGNAVFGAMADYLDKQISKAVIGQTMTTDAGSSRAQSETHDEVRSDITKADARQLASTINRDLIATFVAFNFGPKAIPPRVVWPVEDPEDMTAFTQAVERLVPMGLPVAHADIYQKMGLRVPDKSEAILTPTKSEPPRVKQLAHLTHHGMGCPGCGTTQLASAEMAADDPLMIEALADWEQDMGPIVDPILQAAQEATSFAEFRAALDRMQPDTSALGRRLVIQMMKARGNGDING